MKNICLLDNPISGSSSNREQVEILLALLRGNNFSVVCEELTCFERTKEIITQQIEKGVELFIVSGGDGTVRSVAQHLVSSKIPLLIFPSGNENLLASQLGLTREPTRVLELIKQERYIDIDIADINSMICIAIAGAGIDGEIVHSVHCKRESHINFFTYAWPTVKALFSYRHRKLEIKIDGSEVCNTKAIVFIGNISRYGGGFEIFKDTVWDDGLLNVTVFECKNLFELLYLFALAATGRTEKSPRIRRFKGKDISINAPSEKMKSQIDGDPGPDLPLKIKLIPSGLRLLKP
jgi:YegS/Rv2252/BmrU family lipid kinase